MKKNSVILILCMLTGVHLCSALNAMENNSSGANLRFTKDGEGQTLLELDEQVSENFSLSFSFRVLKGEHRGFRIFAGASQHTDRVYFFFDDAGVFFENHLKGSGKSTNPIYIMPLKRQSRYDVEMRRNANSWTVDFANEEYGLYAHSAYFDDNINPQKAYIKLDSFKGSTDIAVENITYKNTKPAASVSRPINVINNDIMAVSFDAVDASITINDKRNSNVWRQSPLGCEDIKVLKIIRQPQFSAILDTVQGKIELGIKSDKPGEVLLTLNPQGQGKNVHLRYPYPSVPQSSNTNFVLPTDSGIVLPVGSRKLSLAGMYQHGQHGFSMPWFGFEQSDGSGIMKICQTYEDTLLEVLNYTIDNEFAVIGRFVQLFSKSGMRYPRTVRYCIFDEGGYVAMCKRYRQFKKDIGEFKTFEQKQQSIPQITKLHGAANIYDMTPDSTVLDWLIENDVQRVVYSPQSLAVRDPWHLSCDRVKKARDYGYVVSQYDIYSDIAGPELYEAWGGDSVKYDYQHRLHGYPEECFTMQNGNPMHGWGYPIAETGQTVFSYQRCSTEKLKWLRSLLPKELEKYDFDARFFDVETAKPFYECYSEKHPLTRQEDKEYRRELFEYVNSLSMISSAEGGADWASDLLAYQEGSLSLVRFNMPRGVFVGYTPFEVSDEYAASQLDISFRAPLHQLVYADSQYLTWRWNNTPNRWDNRELWDDYDLLHILYGAMPIYTAHKDYLDQQGERLLKSIRTITDFTKKIGGSQMLSHSFLTDDRLVQGSTFDGGISVVVNFDTKTRVFADGMKIEAKSFIVSE